MAPTSNNNEQSATNPGAHNIHSNTKPNITEENGGGNLCGLTDIDIERDSSVSGLSSPHSEVTNNKNGSTPHGDICDKASPHFKPVVKQARFADVADRSGGIIHKDGSDNMQMHTYSVRARWSLYNNGAMAIDGEKTSNKDNLQGNSTAEDYYHNCCNGKDTSIE
eukprot:2056305-Ditylum_brightwellii.AAC.1